MPKSEKQRSQSAEVDRWLRVQGGPLAAYAMNELETAYADWYARLLTVLVLAVGDDAVIFGQGQLEADGSSASVTIVTARHLVRAHIPDIAQGRSPQVVVTPRSDIQEVQVAADRRIDVTGSVLDTWPGDVAVSAIYTNLPDPVVFTGPGTISRAQDEPGPILTLLDALRSDLGR